MRFLPIVARELRLAARRRSTYLLRSAAALALIMFGTWMFIMLSHQAPRQVAAGVFGVLAGCSALYCLLSGVQTTSDTISREKREGTLGLLFLTDLKGFDVVLGKLVAHGLNSFYGVLAVVPMMGIPLLIGGVAPAEFARMAVLCVNTLFFSLCLGMCVSSVSITARKAASTTMLAVLAFAALAPALGAWLAYISKGTLNGTWLFLCSPGVGFVYAFDAMYRIKPDRFWGTMAVLHGVAWVALALACLITPRIWKERPASTVKLKFRERLALVVYGSSDQRAAFRHHLLNRNPFLWLAARARWKPAMVWTALLLLGGGCLAGYLKWPDDWPNSATYIITGLIMVGLMKGWFASECGRQLAEERQGGTLELLLSTPLSVREIVQGQALALRRQFLGPLVLVMTAMFMLMLAGLPEQFHGSERGVWLGVWIGSLFLLPMDLAAIFWVGIWQGMTSRNPARAANGTVLRILILPWVLYGASLMMVALFSIQGNSSDPGAAFFIGLWLFLSLAADVGFGSVARQRVLASFRQVATQACPGFFDPLKRLFAAR